MRKVYSLFFAFIWMASCAPSDDAAILQSDVFVKYYGEPGQQIVRDMLATSDGGYLILASQNQDFYFVLTDQTGDERWSGAIDINGTDQPSRIKSVGENEYVVIGTSTFKVDGADVSELIWAKFSVSGDSLNFDTFHSLSYGNLRGADIIRSNVGDSESYVLLGTTDKPKANDLKTNPADEFFLFKVGAENDSLWSSAQILGFSGNDQALALFEKENGNLIVVGSTEVSSGGYTGTNLLIYELNALATATENTSIRGLTGINSEKDGDEVPHSAIKSPLGYTIVGSSSVGSTQNGFLLTVNASGIPMSETLLISTKYGTLETDAFDITKLDNGDYLVAGQYRSFQSGGDANGATKFGEIMLLRTDQMGVLRDDMDQHYGTSNGNDSGNAIITAPDGDVVVAATIDYGSSLSLIGLMKLNRDGELKD